MIRVPLVLAIAITAISPSHADRLDEFIFRIDEEYRPSLRRIEDRMGELDRFGGNRDEYERLRVRHGTTRDGMADTIRRQSEYRRWLGIDDNEETIETSPDAVTNLPVTPSTTPVSTATPAPSVTVATEPECDSTAAEKAVFKSAALSDGASQSVVDGFDFSCPTDVPVVESPVVQGGSEAPSCGSGDTGMEVDAPQTPQMYVLPADAVRVSNGDELANALSSGAQDIVLADGVYSSDSAFNAGSQRLWSENLGGAVLKSGLTFGGDNGEVHGLRIDISDGGAYANDAVLYSQGDGLKVYDTWVTGNTGQRYLSGIRSNGTSGVEIGRSVVRDVTYNGIMLSDNDVNYTPAVPSKIFDVDIAGVSDPDPGSLNGTAEAGLWVEHTVHVDRAKIRDVSWMGVATEVNVNDATFRNLDIDNIFHAGIAFYIEHYTRRSVIEDFNFGPNIIEGLQSEWDAPEWDYRGAGEDNTIRNGSIASSRDGIYVDQGTSNMTVENVAFSGQSYAAVVDKGAGTTISGNAYCGGVVELSNEQGW